MIKLLMIIDPLKEFHYEDGVFYNENAGAIVPDIERVARERFAQGYTIMIIADSHRPSDPEVKLLGDHAMENTWGAEIIDELSFLEGKPGVHILKKTGYNVFFDGVEDSPNIGEILSKLGKIERIEIIGVCSDICVLLNAITLANIKNLGIIGGLGSDSEIVVYKDCIATFDSEDLSAELKEKFALWHLKTWHGVKVVNYKE